MSGIVGDTAKRGTIARAIVSGAQKQTIFAQGFFGSILALPTPTGFFKLEECLLHPSR